MAHIHRGDRVSSSLAGASYLLSMREICRDAPEKAEQIKWVRCSALAANNSSTDLRRPLSRQVGDEPNSRAPNDKSGETGPRIDHAAMLGWMLLTILTAVLTAALGLATFVAGQIVVKLFEPALDLRSLFGDIARDFIVDFGPGSGLAKDEKRSRVYLEHAGVIHQRIFRVAWYRFFQTVVQLPPKTDVLEAASLLIMLSMLEKPGVVVLVSPKAWELKEKIQTLLRLKLRSSDFTQPQAEKQR